MSDKTGWKGRGQQLRDSDWDGRDRVARPGPSQRKKSALESLEGCTLWGC